MQAGMSLVPDTPNLGGPHTSGLRFLSENHACVKCRLYVCEVAFLEEAVMTDAPQ